MIEDREIGRELSVRGNIVGDLVKKANNHSGEKIEENSKKDVGKVMSHSAQMFHRDQEN